MTDLRTPPVLAKPPVRGFRHTRVVGAVACALVITAAGTTFATWRYAGGRMRQQTIPGLGRPEDLPPPLTGTVNVLAVGTDSRAGLSDAELQAIGTDEVQGERADTIILVHLSPQRPDTVMISFPRDLKVHIPGHGTSKLNAALAYGGPDLLVQTIEDYSGIQIDHYVQGNIAGFLKLVDLVGGVEICLDDVLVDPYAGAHLQAGCHTLRAHDAAAYVRARHSPPGGDLGRIERQQRFLRAAMRKVFSVGTFVNPVRMKRLIDAGADAVITDVAFGAAEMARLAWSMRSLEPDRIDMRTVPGKERRENGVYYFIADAASTEVLFQSLGEEGTPPYAGGTSVDVAGSTHPPGDGVTVRVVNAGGSSGLAAKARSVLEAEGFAVRSIGNAQRFGLRGTVIRYATGAKAKAELVAALFPGARLESASRDGDTGGADVVVLLGTDWVRRRQE